MLKQTEEFIKRLKELRKQIEKKTQEKTIEQIHQDIFNLLKAVIGNKSQTMLVTEFEKLAKQGKFTQQHLKILKDVISARAEFKKGKLSTHKVDMARKNASILINELIDYSQRAELAALEKSRMRLRYKDKGKSAIAEILHTNDASFLIRGKNIQKITNKIQDSDMNEVSKHVAEQKSAKVLQVNPRVFDLVKKEWNIFTMKIGKQKSREEGLNK